MNTEQDNVKEMPTPPLEVSEAHWAILYVEDRQFREDLDKDPRAALQKLTGEKVPDDCDVVIHRRKPNQIHLVLPETVDDSGELTAGQLGMVAAAGSMRSSGVGSVGYYHPVTDHKTGKPY